MRRWVSKVRVTEGSELRSVVYQAGTRVWIATQRGDRPWQQWMILDAGAPLVELAPVRSDFASTLVAFRTSTHAWVAARDWDESFRIKALSSPGAIPSLITIHPYEQSIFTVTHEGSGSAVSISRFSSTESPTRLRFAQHITNLFPLGQRFYVQFENGEVQEFHGPHFFKGQRLPAMPSLDTVEGDGNPRPLSALAGDGVVYVRSNLSISAPVDHRGDAFDRDCNGID